MSSTHQRFPGDCVKRGYLMSQSTRGQRVSLKYTENYSSALFSIQYLIFFHLIVRNVNVKTKHTLSPLLPIESVTTVIPASIEQTKERMTTGRCVAYLSVAVQLIGFRVLLCLYGTGIIHRPCCLHARGSSSSLSSFPTFPLSLTPDSRSICHLEVLC